jgi:propane monooxygenase reductase subunit
MSYRIRLNPFGQEFECGEEETILAAALRQGIRLRYGCKQGGCGRCKAQILEGDVDPGEASSFALMSFEQQQGFALLCAAKPYENLELDVSDYDEQELFQGDAILDFEAEISEIARLTADIRRIRARLVSPDQIEFRPGQYMEGLVPGTDEWRSYSMAGCPSQRNEIELIIKLMPGGLASSYVEDRLTVGERVSLRGPHGQFGLRPTNAKAILVAGGSGVAPILSILRDMAGRGEHREMTFFYGARTRADLVLTDELYAFESKIRGYRFVPALSDPRPDDHWSGETGLITDVVCRQFPDLQGMEAYLCGPPGMIDAAISHFRKRGMREEDILFDKFLSKADS